MKQKIFKNIYIITSFIFVDLWLRFLTKDLGLYNITELAPNSFTLCWALIFSSIIFLIPKRKIERIIYGIVYFLYAIYAIVQYGYYLIFGKFLFFSDLLFAGEGSDYFSYVLEILSVPVVVAVVLIIAIGVLGIVFFPEEQPFNKKRCIVSGIVAGISVLGIAFTPNLYSFSHGTEGAYLDPAFEYKRFVNSAYDLQLTGLYQYVARDASLNIENILSNGKITDTQIKEIESYFEKKEVSNGNDMTGVFEGKNVIIVMMESVDDWLITKEDMPTVYYMMEHGINFTNMYTPNYSSGYTINTEFAFHTSSYPLSTENYTYTLVDNDFNYSIANVFKNNGYTVNSFHYNTPDYYNRGQLHQTFGYEAYHSYLDYSDDLALVSDDSYVVTCDELYNQLTNKSGEEPFMSFVITVTAHLSYSPSDWMGLLAMERYPQYAEGEITEENVIRAKARLTDDMFANLLQRLEEDGLLEDTVIVGFADHYAYGITDAELLQQLSNEAGNSILENTPAFIYCASMEECIIVDKVAQITDLAPTIENLFGFNVPKDIMGSDIFNESYEGYAIFPNNTWITNNAYLKNGKIVYNNGMSQEDISKMNQFIQNTYLINDYILEYDYYSIRKK